MAGSVTSAAPSMFPQKLNCQSTFLCPSRHSASNALSLDKEFTITFSCGCSTEPQVIPGGAVCDYAGNMGDTSPGAAGGANDFYWGGKGTGVLIASTPVPVNPLVNIQSDEFRRQLDPFNPALGMQPAETWQDWLSKIRIEDIDDGTSNTFAVGEMHVPQGFMNQTPYNGAAYYGRMFTHFARIAGPGVPLAHNPSDPRAGVYSFGGPHSGGCQFAFADGSVKSISTSLSTRVAGRLANRSDSGSLPDF